jgi:hypothetical protein
MKLKFRFSMLSILAGLALAPAYCTTITTYNNLANWTAVTETGYQTVTFTGLAPNGGQTNYNTASGLTNSGVEFIGYNSAGVPGTEVFDTNSVTWYNDGSGDALLEPVSPSSSSAPLPYINIVLPANTTALSLDLWTASSPGMSFSITVAGNTYTVPTVGSNTETFWGITSDTPITSIELTVPGATTSSATQALLDNFSFGESDLSAAPEAGAYLLIGSGLIGLVILRKRMKPRKGVPEV